MTFYLADNLGQGQLAQVKEACPLQAQDAQKAWGAVEMVTTAVREEDCQQLEELWTPTASESGYGLSHLGEWESSPGTGAPPRPGMALAPITHPDVRCCRADSWR